MGKLAERAKMDKKEKSWNHIESLLLITQSGRKEKEERHVLRFESSKREGREG